MNAKPKTSQLSAWVDRGVALFCLGTLIPAALAAVDQVALLAPWWMFVVGGGIVLASIGMMIASFVGWKLRSFALVYVTVVTFGLITWPVINPAFSEARKRMTSAISFGVPMRPSGV